MQKSVSVLACLLLSAPYVAGQDSVNPSITTLADANSDGEKTPGYTIITTPQIQQANTLLDPNDPNSFVRHKESLGFQVQVITDAHGGKTGDDAAENIRAWLQRNYAKYNIQYVLLIGDPRPELSEIPMKTVFPQVGEIALSDLYYADLTGNWDLDGDGRYGEWGEDFGSGGVDRHWDVMVGRIPCYRTEGAQFPYADSLEYLDWILEKTMRYERQTSDEAEWRKNALLAMCFGAHSCYRAEAIKKQILEPAGWDCHRVYEPNYAEYCPNADPETVLNSFERACHEEVCEIWNSGKFGLVIGFSHSGGSINPACMLDPEDPNDGYPSFTFHASCSQAYPQSRDNNAYQLLRMRNGGAICTLAATAVSGTYPASWDDPAATPGIMGMAYEYTSRLVAGLTSGQAAYGLREKLSFLDWSSGWRNFVIYNLYGDPALQLVTLTQRVLFVDADAPGPHDGSSWATAYNQLQDALAAAWPGHEVRVAKGFYKPDQDSTHPSGTGDPTATFKLKNGVVIKGGYAGFGEVDTNARDTSLSKTVLSGKIGAPDVNDNSYHVISAGSGICEATVLDGLTVTGGHARESEPNGGGMYVDKSHPTVIDCTFTRNCATGEGGGVYNDRRSVPVFTRCTFSDNSSSFGGGIYNHNASPLVSHTKFVGNLASYGGGIYNYGDDGEPVLSFCKFHDNRATEGSGGAMCNYSSGTSVLTNCIFSRNQARWYGGGIREMDCTSRLINCTFSSNSARWGGGAVYSCWNSEPKLTNCILWDDAPDEISVDYGHALPLVTYSNVQTSDQLPWPGEGNICADPCLAGSGYWDDNGTPDDTEDDFWVEGDYHLTSEAGRWDPNSQNWVQDHVTSPCIDTGNPGCSLGDEPNEPSNIRINMGAYGGTAEASKSPAGWRSIADLTNDFKVDFSDLDVLARYWLDRGQCIPSDLNRDYSADFKDFPVLADNWLR